MPYSPNAILRMPRIASISTLPRRLEGLEAVVQDILPQIDGLFVYLDGHETIPDFLVHSPKITATLVAADQSLKQSNRFLVYDHLTEPSVLFFIDDDIHYPPDYTNRLTELLAQFKGRALVGVHGRIFLPPHADYISNVHLISFPTANNAITHVHEVGMGTSALISTILPINPKLWPTPEMNDIQVAIEAQKLRIPRLVVPRPKQWLVPNMCGKDPGVWNKTVADSSRQTEFMWQLLATYQAV